MTEIPTPPRKPLAAYTADEIEAVAERAAERKESGFIVTPDSVPLFVAALRALARERKR
ncbi:hypothetical protein [Methylobacterium gnaphalii]|uniref:hypothetical protein n=1 Tax=Methylobacterium gnaphalii TaxID=1010610 RepID=UPI001EE3316F|nr:hypothetical protein [Methylobacterium gnaphalii]GJD70531.1 hypothetical protein MMMDOFMJ_3480 [Methylobacterium gnaphalii]GLS48440.1 hypothetical protein GCM10007885_12840 [Methylobacterium gnaphalii]